MEGKCLLGIYLDGMKNKDFYRKIIIGALGVYAYFSAMYLFNLAISSRNATFSFFSIALVPVFFFIFRFTYRDITTIEKKGDKVKRLVFDGIVGFLLGASFVLGYQIRVDGMTSLGFKGKAFILFISAGLSLVFLPLVNAWFSLLDRTEKLGGNQDTTKVTLSQRTGRKVFFMSWGVIMVCWIPAFLAYYPAIMSYDFHRQCWDAVRGLERFNALHPVIHTLLIWVFLHLGEKIRNYQLGMALFSLFQMLILSAVFAYACVMIRRLIAKKWPVILTALVFALLPIHPILALSMTKDILFSAFFLLFLLLIMERRFAKIGKKTLPIMILLDIALIADGILCILFRNNAIYALAVFFIFYVVWSEKERVKVLILCLLILAGGHFSSKGLSTALKAIPGSNVEMCSVIIQTVARAAKFHASSLDPDISDMCNYIVDEEYWERYNPAISDTVKHPVAQTTYLVWKDEPLKMLNDWIQIGITYPNDYIDAWLALTSGYWFLDDVSHAEVLGYGDESEHGLLYTFNVSQNDDFDGIESKAILPQVKEFYKHIVNGNDYARIPIVSNLFKPAFYCWLLMLCIFSLLYKNKWEKIALCMFPFWYLMTLFLGPVVLMRYAYPIVVSVPLLLAWAFCKREWNDEEKLAG